MRALFYTLFILSGAAGLMYESVWTRYIGLFVGHSAYAQIIVLTIFLGGMALGAYLVGERSERVRDPLLWYAIIELVVGLIGLSFNGIYVSATGFAYERLFPLIEWAPGVLATKWTLAALLILPQSILLGTTFPLMTAGVLRRSVAQPGRVLSLLYFANSLGAALGVLIAGFYLVKLAGLPGTLLVAAMLNIGVAGVSYLAARRTAPKSAAAEDSSVEAPAIDPTPRPAPVPAVAAPAALLPPLPVLRRLLLAVSFGTAAASFIYEIAWIRMLSLVLGSATHSFELMLSAFILGLALGAFWIRRRADALADPLRTLGIVQWMMGFLALATLPVYLASFEWTVALVDALDLTERGYHAFTLARYAICLAVMLPSTFCAGITLPLITRVLVTSGSGERAVGQVYAINTFGSIVGVVLASLVLLPLLGVKTLLVVGATLDMALGVLLLLPRARIALAGRPLALVATAATAAAVLVGLSIPVHPARLSSGVFRYGAIPHPDSVGVLSFRDGRTAQVAITQRVGGSTRALLTNGKPDASIDTTWLHPIAPGARDASLAGDIATQVLLSVLTLAHRADAERAAVIGFGSGLTSHYLLTSPHLTELATIEIEPEMIDAARSGFYPANRRAFDDPRSRFVVDDAKAYFASANTKFDLILSEPSNPWVSGVSGLFTTEFYARVRHFLTDDGVFGQWLHLYEISDELVLSVLAAIHQEFGAYEVFLTSTGDMLIVATKGDTLARPDWSAAQAASAELAHVLPMTPARLEALRLTGRAALAPLLERSQANSDFYPILDLGAERTRYLRQSARGFMHLRAARFDIAATFAGERHDFATESQVLVPGIAHALGRARGAALREVTSGRATPAAALAATPGDAGAREVLQRHWAFSRGLASAQAPVDWTLWLHGLLLVDLDLHQGTAGVADEQFFGAVRDFLGRHAAPAEVRDAVDFLYALSRWDFATAAASGERLAARPATAPILVPIDLLRDGLVMAHLKLGNVERARRAATLLAPRSSRADTDLRSGLLEAYVRTAELEQSFGRARVATAT